MSVLIRAVLFASLAGQAAQQVQPPVFASRTWLVPIDVRVVDSSGRPIRDLKESDFTITEDRVPQKIAHFTAHSLTAEPEAASLAIRRADDASTTLQPNNRRIFLIVFGKGRLQPPAKGVDAALTFVRERLLPQDQVAVFAWNRATDFSTDRRKILGVIERFRTDHETIEALLRQHFSGLAAAYRGPEIPAEIQQRIDRIFRGEGAPPMRELVPGRASDAAVIADDVKRAVADAQRLQLLKERQEALAAVGKSLSSPDRTELDRLTAEALWMADMGALSPLALSIEDHVGEAKRMIGELERLYSAIDYLRFVEGEKHVLYVTENGFLLPRLEADVSLAAAANQARVTLNTIQTGGLVSPPMPMSASQAMKTPVRGEPLSQRFVISSMRQLAELTGGVASVYEFADKGLTRVAQGTSSGYLLGYYPTNTALDGRFRRVEIKVNRRGATVLYRHGYFAAQPKAPLDRRRSITYARMASAINHALNLDDIPFRLTTRTERGANRVPDVIAELTLDPSRVTFVEATGVHVAELDVAVLCQDANRDPIGDSWQRVNVRLTPTEFATAGRVGLTLTVRVAVKTEVASVKGVVYDFASDRLGSATKVLR